MANFKIVNTFLIAILFSSEAFLDPSTYPKLIALLLTLIFVSFFQNFAHQPKSTWHILLIWTSIFITYVIYFGLDQVRSILFGHPGRNLGLLSLLLALLTYSYFKNVSKLTSLKILLFSSSLVSVSFLVAKILPNPPLLLAQYSYPLPDSINQNIVSLFLSIGAISGLAHYFLLKAGDPWQRSILLTSIAICVFTLWRIGDTQSTLYLTILIFVTVTLKVVKFALLRRIILILPYFLAPFALLLLIQNLALFKNALNQPLFERLELTAISFDYVIKQTFSFRLPDTTADLQIQVSTLGSQYVDNAHNVFLEFGISFGWLPMASMLATLVILFSVKTIEVSNSSCSFGVKVCKIALLLMIYAALYLTILHPITIFAIAVALSLIYSDTEILPEYTFKSASLLGPIAKVKQRSHEVFRRINLPSKVRKSVSFSLFILPLMLITIDVQQKLQFRKIEQALIAGQVAPSKAVGELFFLSLKMKDREYLDYTGRQLAELMDCEKLGELISTQNQLGIEDFSATLLARWHQANCPYS